MKLLEKMSLIQSYKEDIRQAIETKKVDMTGVPLSQFAGKIGDIKVQMVSNVDILEGRGIIDSVLYEPDCKYVKLAVALNNSTLTKIDLPNCERVEQMAFSSCSNLSEVNLPNCSFIGDSAFNSCSSLQSIDLPKCLKLRNGAFFSCVNLSMVSIPLCYSLDYNIFYYCSNLSQLTIGTEIYKIPDYKNAFWNTPFNSGIGSIYVHTNQYSKWIVAGGWSQFSSLFVSVGDPDEVILSYSDGKVYGDTKILDQYVYQDLSIDSTTIKNIDLPNCIYIGDSAFYNCYSLQSISLPNCSYIGRRTFGWCSSLQSISLPNCSFIGDSAFYQCISFTTLILPGSFVCKVGKNNAGEYRIIDDGITPSIYVPASLYSYYYDTIYWSLYRSNLVSIE